MSASSPTSPATTSSSSASSWSSPRASLVSACFGVSGSVCSKYGLNDEWTNYFVSQIKTHAFPLIRHQTPFGAEIVQSSYFADPEWNDKVRLNKDKNSFEFHLSAGNSRSHSSLPCFPISLLIPFFWQLLFGFFRIVFIIAQLILNSFMLRYFVHSMHLSNSLLASTYNQCFSIMVAGAMGYVLFAEPLPMLWIIGVVLIMAGMCFVQWGNSSAEELEDEISKSALKKTN